MSGDYTRFTFDPAKVFSGIHKQQGRVSLDSDFNEFEEILDRRDRSTAYDTFGGSVIPSTTPDAFKIGVDANGDLTIGTGRAYVDGIQAENFGDLSAPATADFDPAIGNLFNKLPLAFKAQPFYYSPPNASLPFPALSATPGTLNLVYLDVWQREVTSWEDERLLEPALGGPDTATRVQTAWQAKALAGVKADACSNLPPELGPSAARMTAAASAAPPAPTPCVIQPAGGYTGLENRLYRVEIHKAGTLVGANVATFVWSRDNASLVAAVEKITAVGAGSIIKVESTGRDTWMRFEVSQQIELLDDDVELAMRESGTGGGIARITNVNHATGEITIDQNFANFAVPKARHPRIRRWDTEAPADLAERSVTNGTQLALEEGIKISFGDGTAAHDGDTLHAGDYWVFSARTANGEIDVVDSAPPRGILHHFAPLAMVTSGPQPTVGSDCRTAWPAPCECEGGGGCECDWCVTIESHEQGLLTVQDAVKQAVAAGGGTVCIGPGRYRIEGNGLVVSNVLAIRIHGAGVTTVLEYSGPDPALQIERAIDVQVRDLVIVTERDAREPLNAVDVSDAAIVTLERLVVVEEAAGLIGLVSNSSTPRPLGAAIALHGILIDATIRECLLLGGTGILVPEPGGHERQPYLATADLAVHDNIIFALKDGISFDGRPDRAVIVCLDRLAFTSNSIYGCRSSGITLVGVGPGGALDTLALIRDTTLAVLGDGIVVGLDGTAIENNNVLALGQNSTKDLGSCGISLVRSTEAVLRDARVDANRIAGFIGGGIVIDTRVTTVGVTENQIRGCGGGVTMSNESSGERVVVRGNTILGLPFATLDGSVPAYGISLFLATRAEILDNHVQQYERRLGVVGRPT
jgi:hypothetical protein